MSTQNSREAEEQHENHTNAACRTTLTGRSTEWQRRPATAYPPGYPLLCSEPECFGAVVPDEAWNEDCTADFDHTEVVDTLVCSTQQGTSRRYHVPEGVEVHDAE